ncbi:DNA topoisomerase 2 [Entamoeba marina]
MANKKQKLEDIYVKLTHKEQILTRPDTYIGSVEKNTEDVWIYNKDSTDMEDGAKMVRKKIDYTPGLFKIFDEILVNASDNFQRDSKMNTIQVHFNNDTISVMNNGQGIPIEIHPKEKIYIPELIFGHLLTSSNYSDDDKKVTGGRNGYGAKLANIFSTSFKIETCDGKQLYKQAWRNNMGEMDKAEITKTKKIEQYTKVTFTPDYKKFQMTGMEDDTLALLIRRVYDIAGCNPGKKIWVNDKKIQFKTFKDYAQMYVDDETIVYEKAGDRWDVCVCSSNGEAQQISFVNSINTSKGGTHVDYALNLVTKNLLEKLKKKNKKGAEIKPFQVKNHIFIFVKCLIENPAFDSQTKETLKTQVSKFGSKPELSDAFFTKIGKLSVIDDILNWAIRKGEQDLNKTGGKVSRKIVGIPKLDDANKAGTKDGKDCTLILTEGDSAKTLAVSGLSVVGRDYYGVFPLRGKPLNARELAPSQVKENKEFENIAKILGLKYGKQYSDIKELRYGKVMVMADQDFDGSHIKGLLINYFHKFWPSLIQLNSFLIEFITPIVKVKKGKEEISFFTVPQFNTWKEERIIANDLRRWEVKYYKGLGTSKDSDAKAYFSDLDTHVIQFDYDGVEADQVIDLAFNKKRADDRKLWLQNYNPNTYLDQDVATVTYEDFVHKELILFSYSDCERSIPSLVDGFKPSQRKVLWACLEKNIVKEQKVAQLSGLISEKASYHHGEQSLQQTIVNMAQNFCGSNNINLLLPSGQFGSRIQGGSDQAAARYIFSRLSSITRFIFHKSDDQVIGNLIDEDKKIEPMYFVPIIPMVLVNGSSGIGTGWSTDIPNFNPIEIISNIRRYIGNKEMLRMKPWYRGWTGKTIEDGDKGYFTFGAWRRIALDRIHISELPVKVWIEKYKQHLEKLIETKYIKGYQEYHQINTVSFVVDLAEQMTDEQIWAVFKLTGSIKTTNMHMFDADQHIKKYEDELSILEEFCKVRYTTYEKRKEAILESLNKELTLLTNKARFIKKVIKGSIVVNNTKKSDLYRVLKEKKFDQIHNKKSKKKVSDDNVDDNDEIKVEEDEDGGYDYLLSMKIWSLTFERAQKLMKECDDLVAQIGVIRSTEISDMWLADLKQLESKHPEWLAEEEILLKEGDKGTKRRVAGQKAKLAKKATRKLKRHDEIETLLNKKPSELAKRYGTQVSVFELKTELNDLSKLKIKTPTPKPNQKATAKYKKVDTDSSDKKTAAKKTTKTDGSGEKLTTVKKRTKKVAVKVEKKDAELVKPKGRKKVISEDSGDGFIVDDDDISFMSDDSSDDY